MKQSLFIFFILLNCTAFARVDSPSAPEALSKLDNAEFSVWRIENSVKGGTGFFIGENLFVTNDHVVSGMLKTGAVEDMVLSQKGNTAVLKIKRIVALSVLYDLTLLETNETVENYLSLQKTPLESDDPLFISAYPGSFFKRMRQTGSVIYENDRVLMFPVDHSYLEGASGGPVLNGKGQVVGIMSHRTDNMAIVIKPNHLREFIAGNIGLNCLRFPDPKICMDKGTENLRELAEQGSMYAQFVLSDAYTKGKRVEPDPEQAVVWRKKAAEQGHISSQFNLAADYIKGNGVQPNPERAFFWVQQAANQGYPKAQNNLAFLYYKGKGVESDPEQGFMWLEKAAKQNYVRSQWHLCYMYYTGERVGKDLEKSFFWCQKAAEQGHVPSQHALVYMYDKGEGTEKNPEQAAYWLEQAEQARPAAGQIHVEIIEN